MTSKKRIEIKNKFNGKCAYSGTVLEDDWQIDHIWPVKRIGGEVMMKEYDNKNNMVPVQRAINHYKFSKTLEQFRTRMNTLHLRLRKLPKNPTSERGIKRKKYLLKVASYFEITENEPFSGVFYFEQRIIK